MNASNFGKNLNKYMQHAAMTQMDLAVKANISQGAVSKIISGKLEPGLQVIIKILGVFKVSFETFCKD